MPLLQCFIGGVFTPSSSGDSLPSGNPSDLSDVVALVPEGAAADVDAAVAAAVVAQATWAELPGPRKAEALMCWATVLQGQLEELAQLMAREVGKPIQEARGEAARAVAILRYYAGEAVRESGEVVPSQLPETLQFSLRVPVGVVGLVTPWNFPVAIPLWKAAPALAFGNAVVFKPSELSSACADFLARTALEAALPPGLFNVVHGVGPTVGEALLNHPRVRALSFTGSAAVGARVAQAAAARNARFQTEMGGKNPALVLADADLDRAAALVCAGAMRFAGQKCTATSRVIVERKVMEPFLERLETQIRAQVLGPVTDPTCTIGPLIRVEALTKALRMLTEQAPRIHTGGRAERDGSFGRGSFLAPTLVSGVAPDSPLATEELFAPVLVALPAEDLDEAIQLANGSAFGLSAALFTRDLPSALRYIQRIDAGLVRVNGDTTGVDPHAPFGGVKGSSSGSREQGRAARDFYTEIKTIQIS
jgi:acyl-CoA reductase-like NAD-dependent aldehyde dehydrogenase